MFNTKVFGITMLLVALCGFLLVTEPQTFASGNNIENLLRRTSLFGILGIGVAFVIITSGIDLSIGSMVCLSGILLAMFLDVSYAPFDEQEVLAVKQSTQQIVLDGGVDAFKAGDLVRYYDGRRAQTFIQRVQSVAEETIDIEGRSRQGTILTFAAGVTNNDSMGHLAKAYPVQATLRGQSAEAERSPTLTIAGEHRLSNRDQVVLVHPQSGLKRYVLEGADSIAAGTELHIRESLDPAIDAQWVAIPLARRQRMSPLVAVLAVLAIGAALGLIHGLLITKVGHQPFVVTLCGLLIYRGISRWLARDQPLGFGQEYKETLSSVATGKFMLFRGEGGGFGIPYPFFILLGIAVVAAVFLNRTIWGRYMLALGRNKEAAEYSGINTSRMIVIAYVICTSMAAVGGMLFALDANSVAPSSFGNFFELYAIAAAVLGGCSLRGGEGGIVGVVIGTALMQTLNNVIVLKQIPDQLEFAIIGAVILIGVTADEVFKRWAARDRGTKTNSISTGQSK